METTIVAFDALLKAHYSPARIRSIAAEEYVAIRGRREETFFRRIMAGADDADIAEAPAFISLPTVTALATLAGLEWLRRRKNEITEAEQNGTSASLMEEFYTWLRLVIRAWIEAAMGRGAA